MKTLRKPTTDGNVAHETDEKRTPKKKSGESKEKKTILDEKRVE